MRTIKLLTVLLFMGGSAYAGADQWGNERNEVPRTSFTWSTDMGVQIASAPSTYGQSGELLLKSVHCSGVAPSTITFYDAQHFAVNQATRNAFVYTGFDPEQMNFNAYYSSGISYIKIGAAPCGISWDYSVKPGKHGDRRY